MCLHLFLYIFRLGGGFLSTTTRCLGHQLPDKRDSPVAESSLKMQDQEEVHVPEMSPVLSTATSSPVFAKSFLFDHLQSFEGQTLEIDDSRAV